MDALSFEIDWVPAACSFERIRHPHARLLVNGEALHTLLGEDVRLDQPGVVGGWSPEWAARAIAALAGDGPPPLDDGRVPLAVCGACGDYGCGAITTRVEVSGDQVHWTLTGETTDGYLDEHLELVAGEWVLPDGIDTTPPIPEPHLAPLTFDRAAVRATLTAAVDAVRAAEVQGDPDPHA